MRRPGLLWVRAASSLVAPIPRDTIEPYFELTVCSGVEKAEVLTQQSDPQTAGFKGMRPAARGQAKRHRCRACRRFRRPLTFRARVPKVGGYVADGLPEAAAQFAPIEAGGRVHARRNAHAVGGGGLVSLLHAAVGIWYDGPDVGASDPS
jgi:hypothetical protein